jgi:hypothetical protein
MWPPPKGAGGRRPAAAAGTRGTGRTRGSSRGRGGSSNSGRPPRHNSRRGVTRAAAAAAAADSADTDDDFMDLDGGKEQGRGFYNFKKRRAAAAAGGSSDGSSSDDGDEEEAVEATQQVGAWCCVSAKYRKIVSQGLVSLLQLELRRVLTAVGWTLVSSHCVLPWFFAAGSVMGCCGQLHTQVCQALPAPLNATLREWLRAWHSRQYVPSWSRVPNTVGTT